ncbi:MAG: DUF4167 domain-containing protein [Hyphomicrobiales bacterium]
MRPNQHKNRSRGRGRRPGNPMNRVFESNGPDVKVRGNAQHVAEKYLQLARDAQSSGDSVMAENYYQHAEHYLRILAASQPPNAQGQPGGMRRPFGSDDLDDEDGLDGGDEDETLVAGQGPQPDIPGGEQREARPPREGREGQEQREYRGDDQRDHRPRGDRPQRDDYRPPREHREPRENRDNRGDRDDYRARDDQRPRDDYRPRDEYRQRDDHRPPRENREPRENRDDYRPRPPRPEARSAEPAEGGTAPESSGDESNGWAAPDFLRRPAPGGGPGRPRREARGPRPERRSGDGEGGEAPPADDPAGEVNPG